MTIDEKQCSAKQNKTEVKYERKSVPRKWQGISIYSTQFPNEFYTD